jgi:hypothetical protein
VKTSEGFRLHKGVVRNAMSTASLRECEKMCYSEDKFRCSVYSYRYSEPMRDNCLLCDRSFSLLDSYADIVPDRNYDIYAMSDDVAICKKESSPQSSQNYGGSNDREMELLLSFVVSALTCCLSLSPYRMLHPHNRPQEILQSHRA